MHSKLLSDVTVVTSMNVLNKNGYSYLNVLARFGETSQTAAVKNNLGLWIGCFHHIEDGSAPNASLEYT